MFLHTYHSSDSTTTVTRKLFHFSISMVYLFGIKYDVVFLEFCSKLLLFIFLYIEVFICLLYLELYNICILFLDY